MSCGGWTYAAISDFPLSAVNAIWDEWRRFPPVNELVAAFLGYKPPTPAIEGPRQTGDSIAALKAMFPGGIMRG